MAQAFHIAPAQHETYMRDGMLRLPGSFANVDTKRIADALWRDLERRFAIGRDQPDRWKGKHPAQFQEFSASGVFEPFAPGAESLADAVLGPGVWRLR